MDQETQVVSSRSKTKKAIASLVISAMMLALALVMKFVSEMVPLFKWPNGGSITVILVPLALTGLLCGFGWGLFVSVSFSLIDFLIDGVVSWTPNTNAVVVTVFLDYIIAFGVIALAALFRKPFYQKKAWAPIVAIVMVAVLRFISHFFSGVIVWNNIWDYEGPIAMDWSKEGIIYSITYNGGYMLPTGILSAVTMGLLLEPIYSVMDTPILRNLYPNAEAEGKARNPYASLIVKAVSLFALFVIAILSLIPQLKMGGFGILTLCIGSLFEGLIIYQLIKCLKIEGHPGFKVNCALLAVCSIVIIISIVGILSIYTYGVELYKDSETTSAIVKNSFTLPV